MSDLYSNGGRFQKNGAGQPGRRKKRIGPTAKILVVVAVILFSLVAGLAVYGWQVSRSQAEFDRLAAMTRQPALETVPQTTQTQPQPTETTQPEETIPEETEPPKEVLPQYRELADQNPDFWGWISIPGTVVDYPVMHTPQEPEKYLYADFDGAYSFPGTPFLDAQCGYDSDNLLIYGHNMNNGSMFHSILKYDGINYWKKHPSFVLNTLYEEREYEVLAAFYDRVYYKSENVFKFYQFINAADEAAFDDAVAKIKDKALYDTGITAQYGDQLAMLVTCSSHTDNGRFVLVGRYRPETVE